MAIPNEKLCEHCALPLPPGKGTARRVMHEDCKALTVNLPRRCKKCKKVKAASSFSRDASRAEGRYPYCIPCHGANQDKFQDETEAPNGHLCPVDDVPIRGNANRRFCSTPCKDKVAALRKKYGLNIADWRRMVEDAGDRCPICLQRPTSWQVDHNHKTRLTTGVVCINCNVGLLAYSGHDPAVVERLLSYLLLSPAERLGIVAVAPDTPEANRAPNLHVRWSQNRFQRSA